MNKRITAIVVTWNSRKLLPELVRTLKGIEHLCEIVISDNGSTDSTVEDIRKMLPEASVLSNRLNGGFGCGNNRGLEVCNTEFTLLLNSDASISEASLLKLLAALEHNPEAAGVQPLIRLWDWPLVTLCAGSAMTEYGYGYDFDFMHFQPSPDRSTIEVPCITAALSLFRTEALLRVNGFDENIFMYFEDVDLCLRLRELDYKFLLNPDSTGVHKMGASSTRNQAEKWELQSSAYLTRKFLGGRNCRLPDYWKRAEFRMRMYRILKGQSWFWRRSAVRRAEGSKTRHIPLSGEFLMHLLAPRPLRMPYKRPSDPSGAGFPGSIVTAGPGWQGMKLDSCGFGCLSVPRGEGILTLRIRSCNIPGSVALWSADGSLSRIFLNTGEIRELKTEITEETTDLYLVPDRMRQKIELENVKYTYI